MYSKISCRERHLFKDTAGIAYRGFNTFLVGNVEFRGMHYELSRADKPDNGEKPDRYSEIFFSFIAKRAAYLAANAFGNIAAATTAATASYLLLFQNTGAEDHGIYYLNYSFRQIMRTVYGLGTRANPPPHLLRNTFDEFSPPKSITCFSITATPSNSCDLPQPTQASNISFIKSFIRTE